MATRHIIDADGTERWVEGSVLHRLDGPAFIGGDGSQAWYQNGLLHRLDGPARIWANGSQQWWQNGQLHRLDGPASIVYLTDDSAPMEESWLLKDMDITSEVSEWMLDFSIRPDWENWGDVEKILFRLRF